MKSVIQLLGEPYVVDILQSLYESPKRFKDLESACRVEKTRTEKLRKLEESNLVSTKSDKDGKKSVIKYCLTKKGIESIKHINSLEKALK